MRVEVETITPELAKKYLENNCINRNVSQARVKCFAKDMKEGKWQFNGEAIQINSKGVLINGQHRLNAVIMANVTVEMIVIKDLGQDITIFDRGRVRSVSDSLIMSGVSRELANNSNVAVAKLHYYVQSGITVVADSEVCVFLKLHEESFKILNGINSNVSGAKNNRISVKSAPITLACLYALESGVSADTIKRFLEVLRTGLHGGEREYSATICRNDILSGSIPLKGGTFERKNSLFKIEKAICDFVEGYPRKISYNSWKTPIYSNNIIFSES